MSFQAFQLDAFGRLVVCGEHATDLWMWLWLESDASWKLAQPRANERRCAVCTAGARLPAGLETALQRQGHPARREGLKKAA